MHLSSTIHSQPFKSDLLMKFYRDYLNTLEANNIDIPHSLKEVDNPETFELVFKKFFPQKVINLIIDNQIHNAPRYLNAPSKLLSLTAKFCLANKKGVQ